MQNVRGVDSPLSYTGIYIGGRRMVWWDGKKKALSKSALHRKIEMSRPPL